MDTKSITKQIFSKKSSEKTFTIMFFLVFSIFVFFAIRPSLMTAFSLKKEESDLMKIDQVFENKITEIVKVQSELEQNRNKLSMLDQALPNLPELNKVLKDIGDVKSLHVKKANIGEVNLRRSADNSLQQIQVSIEGADTFPNLLSFMQDILEQRRLKTINSITLDRNTESTQSGELKIEMNLEAYYL